jgi:NitT/TauT family transport system substrate-binding protein
MQIRQNRRHFLLSASLAAAAGIRGTRGSLADEGPPEITTLRLPLTFALCIAPGYIADDLLRAEGFSEIRYVRSSGGFSVPQMIGRGEIDLGIIFAPIIVSVLDAGMPVTALAGLHSGCYELFAHEPIRTISDLKGMKVGIQSLSSAAHLYVAIMAKHVGLDPHQDIDWVTSPTSDPKEPMEMFASGQVDAFLGFPPEPQELRGRKIGRVILNTTTEKPWSQYFCCMLFGNRAFVRDYPVATKRALRAILKTADLCATEPETAARRLVDGGFSPRYDLALQTLSEVPYDRWREYDPEDSLRFYALRLHEVGMINSSPNQLLAEGTDWRFLNELKRELKA